MEIRINFLYEKQFQQMIPFSNELIELHNLASATLYKLSVQIKFFSHASFIGGLFWKFEISVTFL